MGCGPGRVTAHLQRLGLEAFGVDLSPAMVDVARRDHPGLRFEVCSMTDPDLPGAPLAVHHRPVERVERVERWLAEAGFHVDARMVREAQGEENDGQEFVLARRSD